MPRRLPQRLLALFALGLTLLAALPCAVLAEEGTCCAMALPCSDASESPCAQLGAASCCEAPQIPLDTTFAPPLPAVAQSDLDSGSPDRMSCGLPLPFDRRPPPPSRSGHLSIRDVILRL